MDFKKFNGSWGDTPVYKYCKTNGPNLVENNITTVSGQGITAVNNNGAVTINGTNSGTSTWLWLASGKISGTATYQELGKGKYTIGGVPADSSSSNYRLAVISKATQSGTSTTTYIDATNDPLTIDNTNGNYNYVAIRINILANTVCDNAVFTPYIKPINNSWYQVEAYKRENNAWTAEPTNGRRLLSIKKPITEELDPDDER